MSKYGPFWQQREFDRILSQMQSTFELLEKIPAPMLESLRAFEDLSRRYSFPDEYLNMSKKLLMGIDKSNFASVLNVTDRIDKSYVRAFEALQSDMLSTLAAAPSAPSAINYVSTSVTESFANVEALARSFSLAESAIPALLRYHDPFEQFVSDKLLAASPASLIFQENMASAIEQAAKMFQDLSYVSEMSALMAPELLESVLQLPRSNIFEELGEELVSVDLEDDQVNVVVSVESSLTNQVVEVGTRLVQLVYELNMEAERHGETPVFKPTTKTMMAFHQVPSTVVSDEIGFHEIVDALYFLLYEGSGYGARLTGRFEDDRLKPLWLLKDLRSGARHDLNHGKNKDVVKKMRSVGKAYEKLIDTPTVKSENELKQAQLSLYKYLADMLNDLWLNGD